MIKLGDKLKTEREFYDLMVEQLNHLDPVLASQTYQQGSKLDDILRTFSRLMFDHQMEYHNLILSMDPQVVRKPKIQSHIGDLKSILYPPNKELPTGSPTREYLENRAKNEIPCNHDFEEKFLFSSSYEKCKKCGEEK